MAPLISNAVQHLITRADEESNFKYEPNKNAALAAAALFGISSVWHFWVMFKNKTWVYTALVVGAFSKTSSLHITVHSSLVIRCSIPLKIYQQPTDTAKHSDDHRLRRTLPRRQEPLQQRSLHPPVSLSNPPTLSLRSNNLYALRSNRPLGQRSASKSHSSHLGDEDFRDRRCDLLLDASRRRRVDCEFEAGHGEVRAEYLGR